MVRCSLKPSPLTNEKYTSRIMSLGKVRASLVRYRSACDVCSVRRWFYRLCSYSTHFIESNLTSSLSQSSQTSPSSQQLLDVRLLRNANDTASRTTTRIPRLLALLVAALAEVVSAGMHNNGASEDALRADQLDELVAHRTLCVALAIGLEVAQVADVAVAVVGRAVLLAVGIDWGDMRQHES